VSLGPRSLKLRENSVYMRRVKCLDGKSSWKYGITNSNHFPTPKSGCFALAMRCPSSTTQRTGSRARSTPACTPRNESIPPPGQVHAERQGQDHPAGRFPSRPIRRGVHGKPVPRTGRRSDNCSYELYANSSFIYAEARYLGLSQKEVCPPRFGCRAL